MSLLLISYPPRINCLTVPTAVCCSLQQHPISACHPYGWLLILGALEEHLLIYLVLTYLLTYLPTDRPTDHATRSVTIGRIYVRSTAMRPKNLVQYLTRAYGSEADSDPDPWRVSPQVLSVINLVISYHYFPSMPVVTVPAAAHRRLLSSIKYYTVWRRRHTCVTTCRCIVSWQWNRRELNPPRPCGCKSNVLSITPWHACILTVCTEIAR